MKYKLLTITVILMALSIHGLKAVKVVDFNAGLIHANTYVNDSRSYTEAIPILSTAQRPDYTGPDVYGGFRSAGDSRLYAAGGVDDAGLRLRWNRGVGDANESISGLFLFKVADAALIEFKPGMDGVTAQAGYMNPGATGPELAVKQAEIRLVFKDDSGYYISEAKPFNSGAVIYFNALSEGYRRYNPSQASREAINTFGDYARPSFKGISLAGFYLKAVRGSALQSGSNVGVTQFTVSADKN
ncbi:MAG: hypothetical protein VXU48_02745 [Verrucomicrobiota bacterium]|nr:hypothetical protein [Verrucomicrobiota bacterium]